MDPSKKKFGLQKKNNKIKEKRKEKLDPTHKKNVVPLLKNYWKKN